jgi:hypothetical protein
MNYIIAGLIGILVWQIIGIIIYEASGENDDVFVFVLCVPVFILNIIGWCYKELYFAWCKNNLNGYILYCNGVSVFSQVYMTDREAEKLYHEGESNYYIKKYSEGHTWKSAPYKGEIYKGQEQFRGLNMKKFWR